MPPALRRIGDFNPLALINRALFGVIYNGDYSGVLKVTALCVGTATLFLTAAALLGRREAS